MVRGSRERSIVLLIAAVQFINILDFMMVMPLGPFFTKALGIPLGQMGLVAGAYTASAAIAGLAGSFFLDRFDRRKALGVAMLGLVTGTAIGGLATGLRSLMLARVVAGAFGGPATSLSISIVADVIPSEERGRAMSIVALALSLAQVVGVPAGLWLAQWGWSAPFFAVAGLGAVLAGGAVFLLPPMTRHLTSGPATLPYLSLFERPVVFFSYAMTAVAMLAGFIVIPNIPGFIVNNLGLPKEQLRWFYVLAGLASIVSIRIVGRLVDRFGSFRVGTTGAFLISGVIYFTFGVQLAVPVALFAVAFSASMALRNVAYNTLTSKVPRPKERARFQSLQSTVQHLASATGAGLSSMMLTSAADGRLIGLERVAWVAIGLTMLLPLLLWKVERTVILEQTSAMGPAAEAA